MKGYPALDLAAPNFVIQEMVDPDRAPEAMELVKEPMPVIDGYIHRPTKPGIGVEVDEAACAHRPPDFSKPRQNYGAFFEDGSVADS